MPHGIRFNIPTDAQEQLLRILMHHLIAVKSARRKNSKPLPNFRRQGSIIDFPRTKQ